MDKQKAAWFFGWLVTRKGSDTSGNYGHKGVKNAPWGKGGSAPGGGHAAMGIAAGTPTEEVKEKIAQHREQRDKKKETKGSFRAGTAGEMGYQNDAKAIAYLVQGLDPKDGKYWNVIFSEKLTEKEHEVKKHLAEKTGIDITLVDREIESWLGTSNDHNPTSLSMQEAVSEEFGIPLSDWQKVRIKETQEGLDKGEIPSYKRALLSRDQERLLARTMYEDTQADLAAAGYKPGDTIRLYRGVTMPEAERPPMGAAAMLDQNAISSWSAGSNTAAGFAQVQTGGIAISMEVPIENIFSTGRTGLGTFGEGEFVVFGVPGSQARVLMWYDK